MCVALKVSIAEEAKECQEDKKIFNPSITLQETKQVTGSDIFFVVCTAHFLSRAAPVKESY